MRCHVRDMVSSDSSEEGKGDLSKGRKGCLQKAEAVGWDKAVTAEDLQEGSYNEDDMIPGYDKEWYKKDKLAG